MFNCVWFWTPPFVLFFCTVLPSASHSLLVQGQSIAPIPGASVLPIQQVAEQKEVETEMGPAVTIMKPILRFLQLLCENHNQDLQVWIA